MKKIILLLGICFYVVGVYAQKLETQTLDEKVILTKLESNISTNYLGKLLLPKRSLH